MSTEEKPLHVQVAEVLGWKNCRVCDCQSCHGNDWVGEDPKSPVRAIGNQRLVEDIPLYDRDWAATGPLIEKYNITSVCLSKYLWDTVSDFRPSWIARADSLSGHGSSPLIAICNLIVANPERFREEALNA